RQLSGVVEQEQRQPDLLKLALTHPLDPLTADEITRAAAIVQADSRLSPDHAVITVQLAEPPKDVVRDHRPGAPWDRQAFVIVRDRTRRATCEATVSLESGAILSWREPTLGMPRLTLSELFAADEVIRAHPGWLAAVRKRGADPELAIVDTWPSGAPAPEDTEGQRIVRALTWIRKTADGNGYARPVEGLMVIFDLDQMQVTRIDDFGIVPLPENTGDFTSEGVMRPANVPHFESLREGPKPIEITQPEGVSFAVDGNLVTWQKWSFRLGFTLREGIVLHQLGYEDKGRIRPILYRAALSEMVVPYGDTAPTHWWKNAFDSGELGVGMLANSLEL
ncbi:MAG: tyramine oxidase, partial [Dehalococcoidia bacterium]